MNIDSLWITLISNVFVAGAVYGAIRSDLKHMTESIDKLDLRHDKLEDANTLAHNELRRATDKCHERLDVHIENHHTGINSHRSKS